MVATGVMASRHDDKAVTVGPTPHLLQVRIQSLPRIGGLQIALDYIMGNHPAFFVISPAKYRNFKTVILGIDTGRQHNNAIRDLSTKHFATRQKTLFTERFFTQILV
ncbi:hypothetical protein D3C87_1451870 [compost metagenome]